MIGMTNIAGFSGGGQDKVLTRKPKVEKTGGDLLVRDISAERGEKPIQQQATAAKKESKELQKVNSNSDGNSVRLTVRDPSSVKINNVIIEILNSQGDVVQTIPPRVLLHLVQSSREFADDQAKGFLIDQRIGGSSSSAAQLHG